MIVLDQNTYLILHNLHDNSMINYELMHYLINDRSEVSWTIFAAGIFVALFQGSNAAF